MPVIFRRKRGLTEWHFCENCSRWPESDYETHNDRPRDGKTCWECHGLDRGNGNCKYEIYEDNDRESLRSSPRAHGYLSPEGETMVHEFASRTGYYYAAIVFRSLIETKGNMLPQIRLVTCHTTAVDGNGTALLVSHDGIHIHFPADCLLKPTSEAIDAWQTCATRIETPDLPRSLSYIGGQELTWDSNGPAPAVLRYLDVSEVCEALADHESIQRGGHRRRDKR